MPDQPVGDPLSTDLSLSMKKRMVAEFSEIDIARQNATFSRLATSFDQDWRKSQAVARLAGDEVYGHAMRQAAQSLVDRSREIAGAFGSIATKRQDLFASGSMLVKAETIMDHVGDIARAASEARVASLQSLATVAERSVAMEREFIAGSMSDVLKGMRRFDEVAAMASVAKTSLLAERALAGMDLGATWKRLQIDTVRAESLNMTVARQLAEFGEVSAGLADRSVAIATPLIVDFPRAELIREIDGLGAMTGISAEVEKDVRDSTESALTDLPQLLDDVRLGLSAAWRGSTEAITGGNPDRVRHALVSLREIATTLLHELAPDEEIVKWSTDSDDYSEGRPTRRTRLRFISRHIDAPAFAPYLKSDLRACLDLIDILQRVHEVPSSLTSHQVEVMIARVGGMIHGWIVMSRSVNG